MSIRLMIISAMWKIDKNDFGLNYVVNAVIAQRVKVWLGFMEQIGWGFHRRSGINDKVRIKIGVRRYSIRF